MQIVTFRRWINNLYLFNYKHTYTASIEHFHAHDGLELLYIHEGSGTFVINDSVFQVRPRTLILIKPFQIHYMRMESPPDYTRSILKIKVSSIGPFASSFPYLSSFLTQLLDNKMSRQLFYLTDEQAAYLESQFSEMNDILSNAPEMMHREAVLLFFYQFFSYFQRKLYTAEELSKEPFTQASTQHINNILKWINDHYKTHFKMEDIARDLHLSPNYLSKLFKEQIGKTITEYTSEKRLEEARALLHSEDLSIKQISVQTGFHSPSYLIYSFKKKFGMTPHQYAAGVKKLIHQLREKD
ncbi:AraC family transcriptional regulator [Paenibacillus vulneris]|uniref:AraC family transcriptional regulator n=1 Tax=Paenibacillus vulneris TaxID=1133364 RepID=A0ABW3UWT7_9BACL|nr:AraC family transcriptional regulator [Paenibacillus sp. 32352]